MNMLLREWSPSLWANSFITKMLLVPIGNLTVIKLVDEVERGTICKSLGPEYTLMGGSGVGTLKSQVKETLI